MSTRSILLQQNRHCITMRSANESNHQPEVHAYKPAQPRSHWLCLICPSSGHPPLTCLVFLSFRLKTLLLGQERPTWCRPALIPGPHAAFYCRLTARRPRSVSVPSNRNQCQRAEGTKQGLSGDECRSGLETVSTFAVNSICTLSVQCEQWVWIKTALSAY